MSNFKFIYESKVFEDRSNSPFPSDTTIEATHVFDDDQTWVAVLWQFCHFLEHIGFEGVRKNVTIDSNCDDALFQKYFNNKVFVKENVEEYCEAINKHYGD